MTQYFRWLPNTITSMNLIAGCVATIYALRFDQAYGPLLGWQWASLWIGVAAIFDFLDGFSARLLRAYSNVGKELDSLADLVSFGVAPGMMVFSLLQHYEGAEWMAYLALIIPVMGAMRLARFNVDTRQTTSFIGLPIPSNAIFWIGAVAFALQQMQLGIVSHQAIAWLLMLCVVFVPLLMVSNLKMFSLKFQNLSWRDNFRRYAIIVAAILFVVTCGLPGLAWTIIFYIILSILLPQR